MSVVDEFRLFFGNFGDYHLDNIDAEGDLSFYVGFGTQLTSIYEFETNGLLTINNVTKRMKGESLDVSFTDNGKSILLFDRL